MKKIITLVAAVLLTATTWAQSPEKMSYQAVVRDAGNALVVSQSVGMQISILQGGAAGTAVYVETQTITSNANGLVSLEIGSGTVVSGTFSAIDWSAGPYFIKTETDPTGGITYTISGTSQLMSVPYALHANTSDSIVGGVSVTETDPVFGASIANGITALDTANWNAHMVDTDTQLDSTGVAALGFVAGPHTVDTDTQLDSTDIANLGYNAGGITTETDPTFTASEAANITATDITNLSNLSGTNTGDQTISRAGTTVTLTNGGTFTDSVNTYTPGTGITISASNVISASTGSGSALAIGDSYQGGKFFWLDASGQHGLIADTADQSSGIQWYNGSYTSTNAVRDGIGAGKFNTERIIANQGPGAYAAQICANYQGGNYGDWYLPSKYELNLLYLQKTVVGGFTNNFYLSSTEFDSNSAWTQVFTTGFQTNLYKNLPHYVRAVRAF